MTLSALVQFDVYSFSDLDPLKVVAALGVMDPVDVSYKFIDRDKGLAEIYR